VFDAFALRLAGLRSRDDGQALVEYALIVGLIAMICVGGLSAIGVNLAERFGDFAGMFS
jgi:Flp pilus assembly pilin Flp